MQPPGPFGRAAQAVNQALVLRNWMIGDLPFEATPATSPDFWANLSAYWAKNQTTADEELFHDIVPFVQAHYNISDDSRERAIAGLSMGAFQAIETGIVHLGYFSWIGAFSPGPLGSAVRDEFRNALKDRIRSMRICTFSRSSSAITIL
jgi:putative esterase